MLSRSLFLWMVLDISTTFCWKQLTTKMQSGFYLQKIGLSMCLIRYVMVWVSWRSPTQTPRQCTRTWSPLLESSARLSPPQLAVSSLFANRSHTWESIRPSCDLLYYSYLFLICFYTKYYTCVDAYWHLYIFVFLFLFYLEQKRFIIYLIWYPG